MREFNKFARLSLLFCLLFLVGSNVSAVDAQLSYNNSTLRCLDSETNDTLSINDCMSFDLVKIGDSQKSVIALLGNPDRLVAGIDTAQIGIYPLTPAKPGDDPYLLVTISNETVTTLMLQGRGTNDQFSFSGLKLGDSAKLVIEKLGSASSVYPNKNSGSELWQYQPYPFSVEIEKGKLVSIQIWNITSSTETQAETK